MAARVGDDCVGLDRYLDLRAFFQLYLMTIRVVSRLGTRISRYR